MRTKIIIGTRGSALALWQAQFVAESLKRLRPGLEVDLDIIKTQGDKILDVPLAKIGSKGLFTKEIEEALLDGRVDLAVHSMKDLPTELPQGLTLAAVMEREDARDVFISADNRRLSQLNPGERVGTSSLRRRAFLLSKYPRLEVVSIRGNIDTRLRKIKSEELAGALLAAAGVVRMGYADRITEFIDTRSMIPAIGQGALAIEIRMNDPEIRELARGLTHEPTERCVQVERAFLRRMGGGCQVPMAAHCIEVGNRIVLYGAIVHPDGAPVFRCEMEAEYAGPDLGVQLADELVAQGAEVVLNTVFPDGWAPGPTTDRA